MCTPLAAPQARSASGRCGARCDTRWLLAQGSLVSRTGLLPPSSASLCSGQQRPAGGSGERTRRLSRWKNCGRFCCCLRGWRSWCAGGSPRWSRCCRCCWKRLGWNRRPPCLRCAGRLSTRWKLSSCRRGAALRERSLATSDQLAAESDERQPDLSLQRQCCCVHCKLGWGPYRFVMEEVENGNPWRLVGLKAACM